MARPTNQEQINNLKEEMNDVKSSLSQILAAVQGGGATAPAPSSESATPRPVENYTVTDPQGPLPATAEKADKHLSAQPEIKWSKDGRYVTIVIDTESQGYLSEKGNVVVGTSGGNITLGETHRGALRLGLNSYFTAPRK